jgi:hypothetical protein
MKHIRRWHLYLSCFFAPLLVFYTATGWYQTFNQNRNKAFGERGDWIANLRSVHVDQIYPSEKVERYSPQLFQLLVAVMSICLLATTALGIYLAFRSNRRPWTVCLSLCLGVALPVLLLWLGHKH